MSSQTAISEEVFYSFEIDLVVYMWYQIEGNNYYET